MRRARRLEAVLAAALLSWAAPAHALRTEKMRALSLAGEAREAEVVSGLALVKFGVGASAAARDAALGSLGARVLRDLPIPRWAAVELPPGMAVASALPLLRGLAGVEAVEPDYAYHAVRTPNDPSVSLQYHLSRVNAFAAWEYEVGLSSKVTVVVVDAGVQRDHPDLSSKFVGTSQFCDPGPDKNTGDDNTACVNETLPASQVACNHGTRVAGVAAALGNNGSQVAGMSWHAQLLSYRIFRTEDCNLDCGPASCATDNQAIIHAITKAATLQNSPTDGRLVVSVSIGGNPGVACPGSLQTAIDSAVNQGLVIVVAAGNSGPGSNTVNQPGNCNNVITVGATDANDNIASFSSRGSEMTSHGVVAPGVSIVTTDAGGGTTGSATGTSFATPLVSGLAALILSAKPGLTVSTANNQVLNILRSSANNIGVSGLGTPVGGEPLGSTSGSGRVDGFRALRLAINGTLSGFEGDQKAIAFPNPFRPSQHGAVTITIPTSLQGRNPEIRVYTQDGQLVRKLDGQSWDGKNADGGSVASGVYVFTVKTDNGLERGRVAVLR